MALGIIYKTTNLVNGKWYIGKYEGNKSTYLGSGLALNRAIKVYGVENFKRETLAEAETGQPLADLEKKYIADHNAIGNPMSYNIAHGGRGGHTRYDEIRSQEHRDNISKALTGRKRGSHKKETLDKMSKASRTRFGGMYKVTFIDTNEDIIIECLGEFAKQHGTCGKTLRYAANNKTIAKGKFLVTRMEK